MLEGLLRSQDLHEPTRKRVEDIGVGDVAMAIINRDEKGLAKALKDVLDLQNEKLNRQIDFRLTLNKMFDSDQQPLFNMYAARTQAEVDELANLFNKFTGAIIAMQRESK